MALNSEQLYTAIYKAFDTAQETQKPDNMSDPKEIKNLQKDILVNLAKALTNAIEAFVKGGEITVSGVEVEVRRDSTVIGTGRQTKDLKVVMK